jgi:hypothetical protein
MATYYFPILVAANGMALFPPEEGLVIPKGGTGDGDKIFLIVGAEVEALKPNCDTWQKAKIISVPENPWPGDIGPDYLVEFFDDNTRTVVISSEIRLRASQL